MATLHILIVKKDTWKNWVKFNPYLTQQMLVQSIEFKVWMGPVLWLTKSIIKKECKLLYIMCVHGNVSQKRCITAFILTSGFSASCVSSQCPPTSSHYSESLKWSAARLPLPADCIGLAGMIISALSKNSPFEAQMVPAESCTKLY